MSSGACKFALRGEVRPQVANVCDNGATDLVEFASTNDPLASVSLLTASPPTEMLG